MVLSLQLLVSKLCLCICLCTCTNSTGVFIARLNKSVGNTEALSVNLIMLVFLKSKTKVFCWLQNFGKRAE